MIAELLKMLSETEKDLLLPDRHRKPKPPRDSVPTSIVDITSHPSFYWERDATQQYLTKNGWDQALEDTRLAKYRSKRSRRNKIVKRSRRKNR